MFYVEYLTANFANATHGYGAYKTLAAAREFIEDHNNEVNNGAAWLVEDRRTLRMCEEMYADEGLRLRFFHNLESEALDRWLESEAFGKWLEKEGY